MLCSEEQGTPFVPRSTSVKVAVRMVCSPRSLAICPEDVTEYLSADLPSIVHLMQTGPANQSGSLHVVRFAKRGHSGDELSLRLRVYMAVL